eukprot:202726-Chlamydomonas_euryale.AAC.2
MHPYLALVHGHPAPRHPPCLRAAATAAAAPAAPATADAAAALRSSWFPCVAHEWREQGGALLSQSLLRGSYGTGHDRASSANMSAVIAGRPAECEAPTRAHANLGSSRCHRRDRSASRLASFVMALAHVRQSKWKGRRAAHLEQPLIRMV